VAGVLELFGGLLLLLGLFTRPVAFILSGLMAVAYFMSHGVKGFWPIMNGGELAALYCFVFLYFAVAAACGAWIIFCGGEGLKETTPRNSSMNDEAIERRFMNNRI
jgi:putative oxidoreductase